MKIPPQCRPIVGSLSLLSMIHSAYAGAQGPATTVTSSTTATSTPAMQTFALYTAHNTDSATNSTIAYCGLSTASDEVATINFFPSDTGIRFSLNSSTGYVQIVSGPSDQIGKYVYYNSANLASYAVVSSAAYATENGGTPIVCAIDSNSAEFSCQWVSGESTAAFWSCNGGLNLEIGTLEYDPYCAAGEAVQVALYAFDEQSSSIVARQQRL